MTTEIVVQKQNNVIKREMWWLSEMGNLWWCFHHEEVKTDEEIKKCRTLYQSLPCVSQVSQRLFPSKCSFN